MLYPVVLFSLHNSLLQQLPYYPQSPDEETEAKEASLSQGGSQPWDTAGALTAVRQVFRVGLEGSLKWERRQKDTPGRGRRGCTLSKDETEGSGVVGSENGVETSPQHPEGATVVHGRVTNHANTAASSNSLFTPLGMPGLAGLSRVVLACGPHAAAAR